MRKRKNGSETENLLAKQSERFQSNIVQIRLKQSEIECPIPTEMEVQFLYRAMLAIDDLNTKDGQEAVRNHCRKVIEARYTALTRTAEEIARELEKRDHPMSIWDYLREICTSTDIEEDIAIIRAQSPALSNIDLSDGERGGYD